MRDYSDLIELLREEWSLLNRAESQLSKSIKRCSSIDLDSELNEDQLAIDL